MHELALMRDVVRLVEDRLRVEPGARVVLVRLRVSALSHLGQDHPGDLDAIFAMAAAGTSAAGARLEVTRIPVPATCAACGGRSELETWPATCPACGGGHLTAEEIPEVVVHELVVR
jgi:Zn finger protein HypA/HybF involved in hydrogenase expression